MLNGETPDNAASKPVYLEAISKISNGHENPPNPPLIKGGKGGFKESILRRHWP